MQCIHFIGIGGVGMNGLAQLAAASGYRVTGSDRAYTPDSHLFQCLEKRGIRICPQDGSGITTETGKVVFSTAIESDNPDLKQANQLNIPLLHRSEFLKELVGGNELIAIAGTAGKTTTTGLLGWIFEALGKDPSVYNGAAVLNWKTSDSPGNVRIGNSGLWIIEADESDQSFLTFSPTHSIITNISKDHYELDELHDMFNRFEDQTGGITIRGDALDAGLLPPEILRMPGGHNLENARSAFALCVELGMDPEAVKQAIHDFKGIERRLETTGMANGITVIDDYAHNPAKIQASLRAVSGQFPRVHAFWRPHGFSPLANNMNELVETFSCFLRSNHGTLCLLPVYYAGGSVNRSVDSDHLIERLNSAGVNVRLVQDYAALKTVLESVAQPGDAILGMGARDPELPLFAKQLVNQWKKTT